MGTVLLIYWDMPIEAFSIGKFSVRYYGLFFIAAYTFASLLFIYILKREKQPSLLFPVTLNAVFLSSLLGARLGECFFYYPEYYLAHPIEIVLPFHKGVFTGFAGLSSHGAFLLIPFALYFVAKNHHVAYLWLLDRVALVVALAAVFIRLGNLMNSEIVGTLSNVPWSFVFVNRGETFARHPVQLYEALAYCIIFAFLLKQYLQGIANGYITALFFVCIFSARLILESYKAALTQSDLVNMLTTGQFLSLPIVFVGLTMLMSLLFRSENKIPKL